MTRKIIDFFSIMSKIIDSKRWMRGQVFLDQTSAACDAKVHFHRCIRNKLYDEWFFLCTKAVILNEELKSCVLYDSYKFMARDNYC